MATPDDCFEAEAIAKADPEVRRLLLERHGVSDMALVACDPWSVHLAPREAGAAPGDTRLIQCFMYLRSSPNDNQCVAAPGPLFRSASLWHCCRRLLGIYQGVSVEGLRWRRKP